MFRVTVTAYGREILNASYLHKGDAINAAKSAALGESAFALDAYDRGYLSAAQDLWSGEGHVVIPIHSGTIRVEKIEPTSEG